jgi:hypothetical protein
MKYIFILFLIAGFYRAEAQNADSLWCHGPFVPAEILKLPAGYKVVSFVFEFISKGDAFIEKNNGPVLNTKCQDILNRMALPQCKISIEDVIVEKDGKKMKWKGKTLTVK